MRIGNGLHQIEDDRVEENEARLLKQASAELLGCFDGNGKDEVREFRKRAVPLPSDQGDRPSPFAI